MVDNSAKNAVERIQVNVRVDGDLIRLLDEKRTELLDKVGSIPSRSEVIRMALEEYLNKK
ncbi:ribbon-helix-helix protein, CopG family [Methylotenera sp. N17]|uniref:ribbon-helix-helix protein, CopG family n=1 Tax=Methylotenera sp. N17 TaxID=1502761 RepID=UPI0006468478|nr:ribbon-helix-helix protein, CopG family [Methylotenera sp. N17]